MRTTHYGTIMCGRFERQPFRAPLPTPPPVYAHVRQLRSSVRLAVSVVSHQAACSLHLTYPDHVCLNWTRFT